MVVFERKSDVRSDLGVGSFYSSKATTLHEVDSIVHEVKLAPGSKNKRTLSHGLKGVSQ